MADGRARIARKLVRIREIDERTEILKTREARDNLARAEEAEEESRDRKTRLVSELENRAAEGMNGNALVGYAMLLDAASRSVEQATHERGAAEEIERRASSRLLSAVRERQAAEKLADRLREEIRKEAQRREQRELDEIATQRFGR